jgi:hypothetical protein
MSVGSLSNQQTVATLAGVLNPLPAGVAFQKAVDLVPNVAIVASTRWYYSKNAGFWICT